MEVCGMEPTTDDAAASKVAVESSKNWDSLFVALTADWERHMLKYINFLWWCDSGGKVYCKALKASLRQRRLLTLHFAAVHFYLCCSLFEGTWVSRAIPGWRVLATVDSGVPSLTPTKAEMEPCYPQFAVGNVALLLHKKTHRSSWPLGRISEAFPDQSDGLVRKIWFRSQHKLLRSM